MNKILFFLFMVFVMSCTTDNNVFYVSMDGNDSNDGLRNSKKGAWKTLDHAIQMLKPGDKLLVNDGVYKSGALTIKDIQGNPDLITSLKAIHPWKVVIEQINKYEDLAGLIIVSNCSYIEIEGFEVVDTINTGIGITVRDSSHHVTVRNCYIHDCGCNGLSSRTSDYLIFEDNVVRGNAKRNKWNCSGISIWHPIEYDQEPGYHIRITGNIAFENECDIAFSPHGFKNPTDGNGIIIDDFHNTQGGGQEGGYKSHVLVENNLSFNNGGRGIAAYESDNVTIRNNTVFHNLRILNKYADFPGDISVDKSFGSRVYNNVIVKNPELRTKALRCYFNDSVNTMIYNNVVIGPEDFCGQEIFVDNNIIRPAEDQDYPGFINPDLNLKFNSNMDFRKYFGILKNSPLKNAASSDEAPEYDRDGVKRIQDEGIDIGCYEWQEGDG